MIIHRRKRARGLPTLPCFPFLSPAAHLTGEGGVILVAVLLATAVLSLLAAAVFNYSSLSLNTTSFRGRKTVALYLAESGVNEALYRLDLDPGAIPARSYPAEPPSFSNLSDLFSPGYSYQVWVNEVTPGVKAITARGNCNGQSALVTLRAALPTGTLFPRAIIETKAGRPYYDPDYRITPVTFQPPSVPDQLVSNGRLKLKNGEGRSLAAGTYWFEDIDLKNGAGLTIAGPSTIYITGSRDNTKEGNLTLEQDSSLLATGPVLFYINGDLDISSGSTFHLGQPSQIQIADSLDVDQATVTVDAPTSVYVADGVSLKSNSSVGTSPADLVIYTPTDSTRSKVELKNQVSFFGGICAPTADVKINSASVKGSVVGYTVDLKNGASVTYDQAMANVLAPGAGWTVQTGSWGWGP